MKDTKLIIVTGMSGVGKSTSAQNLARLFQQNDISYTWYHEEMKDHPIRWINGGEFTVGDLCSEEGMELNIADMFDRWTSLINKIMDIGGVHIMEGCLYENINRYFFRGNYSKEKIIAFYDKLMKILELTNLQIIFLYRPKIKENLEKAFVVRGDRWKNLILNPKSYTYFDTHEYVDNDSVFSMWEEYQNLANSIFERYQGSKIKIDTSEEQWHSYLGSLAEYLNIKHFDKDDLPLTSIEKYCGRYFFEDANGKHEIDVISENGNLYCSPFWFKHILMNSSGNDEFELLGFPMKFSYVFKDKKKFIRVTGNYDWDIVGNTLEECEAYAKGSLEMIQ